MLGALATVVSSAAAGPPSWLAEAVALGATKAKLDVYRVPEMSVEFTTPFLRAARAANKIAREGRPPRAADIEAKAWVPELRVLVGALPMIENGRLLGVASPTKARFTVGAGEVAPTRMDAAVEKQSISIDGAAPREVSAGRLRAVFEIRGAPPAGGELEVRYAWPAGGRGREIVRRAALDFRQTRW